MCSIPYMYSILAESKLLSNVMIMSCCYIGAIRLIEIQRTMGLMKRLFSNPFGLSFTGTFHDLCPGGLGYDDKTGM